MKITESEHDIMVIEMSNIAYKILDYLAEHPKSRDTMEGILEWWLLEQRIKNQTKKVKEALSELIAKDFVLEHRGRNSMTYYQINHRKFREIQTLLNQRLI